jgi:hypothetical protein
MSAFLPTPILADSDAHAHDRHEAIAAEFLAARPVRSADLPGLSATDLRNLFHLYDQRCFGGTLAVALATRSAILGFRLAPRMTRSAGATISRRHRSGKAAHRYEIAIASRLLDINFAPSAGAGPAGSPVTSCGLPCPTRLSALQRTFEHELIHLFEMLASGKSSCSAKPFQSMARSMFGHLKHTHSLLTPVDTLHLKTGLKPGDAVIFAHQGLPMRGLLARVTRRATVLVPHAQGRRYSDGRRYVRYLVPVTQLKPG